MTTGKIRWLVAAGVAVVAGVVGVVVVTGTGGERFYSGDAVTTAFAAEGIMLFPELDIAEIEAKSELKLILTPERDFTKQTPFRVAIFSDQDAAEKLTSDAPVSQIVPAGSRFAHEGNVVVIHSEGIGADVLGKIQRALARLPETRA